MQDYVSIKNRKEQLRTLANQVQYLTNRKKAAEKHIDGKSHQSLEIDAHLWILAQYQMLSGYDVVALLKEFEGINLERYQKILKQAHHARKYNRSCWIRTMWSNIRCFIGCLTLGRIFPYKFSGPIRVIVKQLPVLEDGLQVAN